MPDDNAHEKTIRSERGFDGKLVHVRVDHVRLPSGREGVREVVEHPGAVGVVALTARDEVVLVRQWRHAVQQELLEIPAGTAEPGESPEETARRELIEETGYRAGSIRQIACYYSSAGFLSEQLTLFLAEDCAPGDRADDADERTEVFLVPRGGIADLIDSNDQPVRDAKTLIGLLWLMRG
ncbi:MAG: NUDIX hydrolase [Thermomicrobiales bacterium]|nr:NUDIX hydrolase [Thermomicrobiales bacterium]